MKIWRFFTGRCAVVDLQLLGKKSSLIREYLAFLKRKEKNFTAAGLKKNFSFRIEVAYALQTIIQACIDICTHLASDEGWELPNNAAHAFKIALRHKVISEKVCTELQNAVKLRNVIVHQYDELDESILASVVKNKLQVFLSFLNCLQTWINSIKD